MQHTYQHLINGELVDSKAYFAVINPSSEQIIADCPAANKDQVIEAINAANKAFNHTDWQHQESQRRAMLRQAADLITQNAEALAMLLTEEQGKPLKHARAELDDVIEQFNFAAAVLIPNEILQDDSTTLVEVKRKPIGVVAIIAPWNYPLGTAAKMAIPLLLGNTVILKPSPYTPLATLKLGALLQTIFPAGVINIIAGDDDVGEWLVQNPLVKKISFTGSVATGKIIAKESASELKRITLELGGNDAAIVLADADYKKIANKLFWGAFSNCGQVCIAIKRLYIHEKIFAALAAELVAIAESIKVDDGLLPETQMGPLNNIMQLSRVMELISDAELQGAEILTGGQRINRPGYFYPPTLITNIAEGVRLVDEEQFGPVLPLIPFCDLEDVITRANASSMGLGASVWTSDLALGIKVANRLQAGTVWVNQIYSTHVAAPFGGFKESGLGREGGNWGIEAYSEVQTLSINKK